MKVTAISDIHGRIWPEFNEPGDLLILAGDLYECERHGPASPYEQLFPWLNRQPFKYKVVVAGNHDWWFYRHRNETVGTPQGIIYLQDAGVVLDGVSIWGSPWQPLFCHWAFNLPEDQLAEKFMCIPSGVDILVTHGPRYGTCDTVTQHHIVNLSGDVTEVYHLGSTALRTSVNRAKPRWHISGHIHSADHDVQDDGTTKSVNVSMLNEDYTPAFNPFNFTIQQKQG